jgi:hypothetical protein
LRAAKPQWVLGIPVQLQLTVTNQSASTLRTSLELDPKFGDVSLFVSEDGAHFRQYLGPDWGTVEINRVVTLTPAGSNQATFSVLWNNDLYRKPSAREQFLGFPKEGTYVLKAMILTGVGKIESNPIEVALLTPTGTDREVWEAIRSDSKLARFIQDPRPDEKGSEKLVHEVTRLLNTYPTSAHSAEMARTLDRYSKRKQQMERMHQQ